LQGDHGSRARRLSLTPISCPTRAPPKHAAEGAAAFAVTAAVNSKAA
jgi:hypothetical protein